MDDNVAQFKIHLSKIIQEAYDTIEPDDVLAVLHILHKQAEAIYMRHLMRLAEIVDEAMDNTQPRH